ncbi:MAG: transporter substrate-binding domain-containing protein, partial [Oscillospiraceae bacterium]|nr:transporter substrate-binding domain-containing protein [Oscillospiraceae bacterium]
MMKRLFILLLTLVFLIPLLAACASVNEESTQDRPQASLREEPLDYTYFEGKDIAVITGVLTYNTTERIGGNPVNYNDSSSAAEDVRQGRVAGYMHTLTAVQVMAAQLNGFEAIAVPKEIFSAQVAGISHDQSVIDSFDAFLSVMETDGTLAEMRDRWFGDLLDLDTPIPDIPNSGNNGVLRIAT